MIPKVKELKLISIYDYNKKKNSGYGFQLSL